jgi:hypothetical protein
MFQFYSLCLIFKDIPNANIYSFSERKQRFVLIDDAKALEILERLGEHITLQEIATKYNDIEFGNPTWTDPYLRKANNEEEKQQKHEENTNNGDGKHVHTDNCCSHGKCV